MEENVNRVLRAENPNRVFVSEPCGGVFECLSLNVFKVKLSKLQKAFKGFMRRDKEKELFRNMLQLLDNTGRVPVRKKEESDDAFKRKIEKCYNGIVDGCTNSIQPYTEFLHVYVFAIATMIGRPIYILHEDETGDLSWSYFPFLYSHTYDVVRKEPRYTTHHYLTMFFSTDKCYMIDSSRCQREPPLPYGLIGVYYKRLKEILLQRDKMDKIVQQLKESIQSPDKQQKLSDNLTLKMMIQVVKKYNNDESQEIHMTRYDQISDHRPNREDFLKKLLSDDFFLKCLYMVSVNNGNGHLIWSDVEANDGKITVYIHSDAIFNNPTVISRLTDWLRISSLHHYTGLSPAEFHKKLSEFETTALELQAQTVLYRNQCTDAKTEFDKRRGRVNKAVISGSVIGIVGAGLAIAGLILTPFTFGASLGLTIAGASLGAAGGVTGGTARAVEGVKQNSRVKEINEIQGQIAELENKFVEQMHAIETIIEKHSDRNLEHNMESPGIHLKGFMAIGSAVRSLKGVVALTLGVVRIGVTGAVVATSILGPLSLAIDIGFLAEAAHDLHTGSKTRAGKILDRNAKAVNMKMEFYNCMVRGNFPRGVRIVR